MHFKTMLVVIAAVFTSVVIVVGTVFAQNEGIDVTVPYRVSAGVSHSLTYRVYARVTNRQFRLQAQNAAYTPDGIDLADIPENDEIFISASWNDANWYCGQLSSTDEGAPQAQLMTYDVLVGLYYLGGWKMDQKSSEWIADRMYQSKKWYIGVSYVGQPRFSEDPDWGGNIQFRCMRKLQSN